MILQVLRQAVRDDCFYDLFSANSESDRKLREGSFVFPIMDTNLLRTAKQAHGILNACRTYVRVFDSEPSLSSEVYHPTELLADTLHRLRLENLSHPFETNRDTLMRIFNSLRHGPLPGMEMMKISLLSDRPPLCRSNDGPVPMSEGDKERTQNSPAASYEELFRGWRYGDRWCRKR